MKQILQQRLLWAWLPIIVIASCSNTPNNIIMTANQNQCVQASMYASPVSASPLIANNPQNAPYCMSISIQNNNSGLNANNVQITNQGLTMSYTVGSTNYSAQMYDPVASGIGNTSNQILGNIAVFDPNNCVTSSGANVATLNSGGTSCTFYMQIINESNPVGIYATNLTYNYTNGTQNYSVSTNVNQRVNLFAGGTTGLLIDNSGSWVNSSSLPVPIPIPTAVTSIARDIYGNVYIATDAIVYKFDGASTTQVANTLPGLIIHGITTDLYGSVYIATNNGIFKYNVAKGGGWLAYNDLSAPSKIDPTTNVISIKSYENFESTNIIYATTESQAFVCNAEDDLADVSGCHWSLLTIDAPQSFLPNALVVDYYNNLYTANADSVNTYSSLWQMLPYFSGDSITGTLSAVAWLLFNNSQYLYVAEHSTQNPAENVVYVCNPAPTQCGAILSQNGNSLTGNVYAITADGANNIYAVGNNINSMDFSTNVPNVFGAYLAAPQSGFVATTPWTPILSGSPAVINGGTLTVLKVSSMLTSY